MIKSGTLYNVMGFDYDSVILDSNDNVVSSKVKTVNIKTEDKPNISTSLGGNVWFNTWNEDLLTKLRNYQKINL
jgi:hypothetical protein